MSEIPPSVPVIPPVVPSVGEKITVPPVSLKVAAPKKKTRDEGIFNQVVLSRKITLHITEVGRNLFRLIQEKVESKLEGKCTIEGYIKPNSIRIVSTSSGTLYDDSVEYVVVFECLLCCPVEGMIIKNCVAENITKAGIRAKTKMEVSPLTIFIARDHHYDNTYFSTIKENDEINIRVIGIRYELNDPTVSVISELVKPRQKPKILLK